MVFVVIFLENTFWLWWKIYFFLYFNDLLLPTDLVFGWFCSISLYHIFHSDLQYMCL